MKKEIIINSTINEDRIAITEDGKLSEFFIELPDKEKYVGNIYLGKVTNVVQGINAAFVNIGFKNDAFLHFSDMDESLENSVIIDEDDDEIDDKVISEKASIALRKKKPAKLRSDVFTFSTKRSGDIQINVQSNQLVIVQVTREAYSTKGVKITSKIAIPGRYTVLMPFESMVGVSKKIQNFTERKRLRKIIRQILPDGYGCIIRTAAKNHSDEELEKDLMDLVDKWNDVVQKIDHLEPPALLYQDMELASSIIRDLFTNDVEKVVIDSKKLYNEIITYLQFASPKLIDKVELYRGNRPVFETYNIERDLANTFKRKIMMKSGASFVIDHTEAMIVVDVNSGRSNEKDQEKTAFYTNLEVCKEIARQIKLRDLAGMIVIDFIDMMEENNRKKLYNEMKKELAKDRAKTIVYPLTQLGLLQITRQRISQNIVEKVSEICHHCEGTGRLHTKSTTIHKLEKWLKEFRNDTNEFRLLMIVHPSIAEYLTEGTISRVTKLMMKYFVRIKLQQSDNIDINSFKVFSVKRQREITKDYL